MQLIRISELNLDLAVETASKIFPYEVQDGHVSCEAAYRDSIDKKLQDYAYFLAYENVDNTSRVVGITGWYRKRDGSMWLGWFGVAPDFRGKGFGQAVLEMTAEAVAGLSNEMNIYSGVREEEHTAHRLYEKNGFMKTGSGSIAGEDVFFFRGPVPIKKEINDK